MIAKGRGMAKVMVNEVRPTAHEEWILWRILSTSAVCVVLKMFILEYLNSAVWSAAVLLRKMGRICEVYCEHKYLRMSGMAQSKRPFSELYTSPINIFFSPPPVGPSLSSFKCVKAVWPMYTICIGSPSWSIRFCVSSFTLSKHAKSHFPIR